MEPIIGPVLVKDRLIFIGPLIKIMTKLVVNCREVLRIHFGAHLDANIFLIIQIPSRSMTLHFPILWLCDQGTIPEGLGQGLKAHRCEESFGCLNHFQSVIVIFFEQGSHIDTRRRIFRCNHLIDVTPALAPHITKQIGTDRTCRRLNVIAIFFVQCRANITVKLFIERLYLPIEAIGLGHKVICRHVITCAP